MSRETVSPPITTFAKPDFSRPADLPQTGDVTLQVNLLDGVDQPTPIKVSGTIFTRLVDVLGKGQEGGEDKQRKAMKPYLVGVGVVVFAAAAVATSFAVKKVIEERQKQEELKTPLPVLTAEQQRDFDLMWERSREKIHNFILRRVGGDEAEADDVTQKVFLSARRNFPPRFTKPSLKDGDPYAGWLYDNAYNKIKNVWRDISRRRARYGDSIDDENRAETTLTYRVKQPDLVEGVIAEEEAGKLLSAIDGLSDSARLVIWLKEVEHFPMVVIGEILGKKEGAVKSLYFRAKKELRKKLEQDWDSLEAD